MIVNPMVGGGVAKQEYVIDTHIDPVSTSPCTFKMEHGIKNILGIKVIGTLIERNEDGDQIKESISISVVGECAYPEDDGSFDASITMTRYNITTREWLDCAQDTVTVRVSGSNIKIDVDDFYETYCNHNQAELHANIVYIPAE